jgi:hypothetical protein
VNAVMGLRGISCSSCTAGSLSIGPSSVELVICKMNAMKLVNQLFSIIRLINDAWQLGVFLILVHRLGWDSI